MKRNGAENIIDFTSIAIVVTCIGAAVVAYIESDYILLGWILLYVVSFIIFATTLKRQRSIIDESIGFIEKSAEQSVRMAHVVKSFDTKEEVDEFANEIISLFEENENLST